MEIYAARWCPEVRHPLLRPETKADPEKLKVESSLGKKMLAPPTLTPLQGDTTPITAIWKPVSFLVISQPSQRC